MKKFFTMAVIAFFVLASCDNPENPGNDPELNSGSNAATLTIRNMAFSEIVNVTWNGVPFTPLGIPIHTGSNVVLNVPAGTGFIFFARTYQRVEARTAAVITVDPGERAEFTFLNSTLITDMNPANLNPTGRFDTLLIERGPLLRLSAHGFGIEPHGNFNVGSHPGGSYFNIRFGIHNVGNENLTFSVTNDSETVIFTENDSGYFSITQHPFANTQITPWGQDGLNIAVFDVRFSPPAAGGPWNAVLRINTNCRANEEFTFRVTGSGF